MLQVTKKLLMALTFTIKILQILSHKCVHDQLNIKPKINPAMEQSKEENLRFLQSTAWSPINIYIDYTYLNTQTTIDAKTMAFTKQVVDNTIKIFSNILSVQRINPKLILAECAEIPKTGINTDLQSKGITADIAIIPFFDLAAEKNTEAYAAPCTMDPTTKRPNGGIMAFNPKNFIIDRKNALEYYTMLVLHEINHILCLSGSLFEYFVDSSYKTLPLDKVMRNATVNEMPKQMIVTPKVVSTAQKHFGCSALQGVEIEDQGGSGTAGSHWESRVMLGDFMIGESYPENVISEISLALFEDSGWYKVNYYTGGLFRYGKNKGCDFVQKKCINAGKSSFPNDFCITGGATMCFASRTAKGFCDLGTRKETIPQAYKYFSDAAIGGFLYADFCPVARWEGDAENNMFFSSSCAYGVKTLGDLGETIGTDSACFMSSLVPKTLSNYESMKGQNRAICYSYKCNAADETYVVTILDKTVNCNKEGGVKRVDGLDGGFYCADYFSVCTKAAACKDAIECGINKVAFRFPALDYTIDAGSYAPLNSTVSGGAVVPQVPGGADTSSTGSGSGTTDKPLTKNDNSSRHVKTVVYVYLVLLVLVFGN